MDHGRDIFYSSQISGNLFPVTKKGDSPQIAFSIVKHSEQLVESHPTVWSGSEFRRIADYISDPILMA
jgi:hypothetical protein